MKPLAWIALLCMIATGPAGAALTQTQRQSLLDEAQTAYDSGAAILPTDPVAARESFRLAATRFRQLVDDGVSNGPLRYNLGNAYLQAGDLGRAILEYRAALVHAPGDERILHNIEHARSQRHSRIAQSGERALRGALLAWHDRTPLGVRFAVFAGAWCVFWLLLIAALFRRVPGAGWVAAACAALWLASGVSLAVSLLRGPDPVGVVLGENVVVRKGNGLGFEPQFEEPLYPGAEFVLRSRRPGWLEIELADGTTGWIPESEAGLVVVP